MSDYLWVEREMCSECGMKYFPSEIPDDCICEERCPMMKEKKAKKEADERREQGKLHHSYSQRRTKNE